MADSSRIEDLRRRVQKDPASIAFAQLAEELRRAGQFEESIGICRAGLAIHPGYLSARVTLGRALVELNLLDDAQAELEHVLASAPENLAAIRGLAEISHRNGNLPAALSHYRSALTLAKNDPDLQETVKDLSKKVEPPKPPASADGLSLEQVTRELSIHRPPPATIAAPSDVPASLSEATPPVAAAAFPSDFFATAASPDAAIAAPPAPPDVPASHSEAAPPVAADAFPSDFFATQALPDTAVAASPAPSDVLASLAEATPPLAADAFHSDFFATAASPDAAAAASPAPPDVPASLSEATPPVAADALPSDFFATLESPVQAAAVPEPTMDPAVVEPALLEWIAPPAVAPIDVAVVEPVEPIEPALAEWVERAVEPVDQAAVEWTAQESVPLPHESLDMPPVSSPEPRGTRVVAALEQWLEAIHVTRDQHGA